MRLDALPGIQPSRRGLLKGAVGLAAASLAVAAPGATSVHPHRLRLWLEGDVNLAWVHSLYDPGPIALPPGVVARLRIECPAAEGTPRSARSRATAVFYVFGAPAGVPPGEPAAELFPISRLHAVMESIVLSVAQVSDPTTRPAKSLVMSGVCIANDVPSPFGLLTGRVAYTALGFEWTGTGDEATFKLVTVGAAGSHVTIVPEAGGEIALG